MNVSAIIPAHNEAGVIADTLRSLLQGHELGAVRVLVVCNGCTDSTANVARGIDGVTVLESSIPSKVAAVNLGLETAPEGTAICVDADIRLSSGGLAALAAAINVPEPRVAAPSVRMDFGSGASWTVRAYYRLWLSLPYVAEGMVGCGVYALNDAARRRLGKIPQIIADDGYVRGSFAPAERVKVESVIATVRAPRTMRDLVKIKTRSRLGRYQLDALFGGKLPGQNERQQHGSAWRGVLFNPARWLDVAVYLYVNAVTRYRARRQFAKLETYVWERDESTRSRQAPAAR
jgi:glycosyltransferase involved in cell wall biosynthesis